MMTLPVFGDWALIILLAQYTYFCGLALLSAPTLAPLCMGFTNLMALGPLFQNKRVNQVLKPGTSSLFLVWTSIIFYPLSGWICDVQHSWVHFFYHIPFLAAKIFFRHWLFYQRHWFLTSLSCFWRLDFFSLAGVILWHFFLPRRSFSRQISSRHLPTSVPHQHCINVLVTSLSSIWTYLHFFLISQAYTLFFLQMRYC